MRLSRSESAVLGSSKDKILKSSRSKKKHKRLDAICEKVYTRNHNAVERMELNEGDVGGNENERRKSTRIRRAPEVLDASPMPPKKRRRIDKSGRLSRRDKGKRVVKLKSENLCSTSKDSEEGEGNLVGWRSRLRTRRKFARFGGRKKKSFSPKGKRKIFEDFDEVNEETGSRIQESDKEEEVIGGRSSAGKSKREGEEVAFGIQESDEEEEVIGGRSSVGKSKREGEEVAFGIQESDEEEEVIGGRSSSGKSKREGEEVAFGIQESDKEEEFIGWRSSAEKSKRLGRSFVRFGGRKKENFSPKGRRKSFEDFDEVNEETTSRIQEGDKEEEVIGGRSSVGKSKREGEEVAFGIQESDKEEEFIGGRSSAAKSKRLGRVKVLRGLENEDEEIDFAGSVGEDKEVEVEVALGSSDEGNGFLLKSGMECASVDESKGGLGSSNLVEKEKTDIEGGQYLEDHHSNGDTEMEHHSNDDAEMEHHSNDDAEMQLCKQTCNVVEHQIGAVEVDGDTEGQPKVGEINDKHTEAETSEKLNKTKHASDGTQRPMRIKEGRRCGLCGGATDGKPPKKLALDGYSSYDDACSGGSASEEPNYDVWDGFGDEPSWLGRLLGPVNDRFGIAGIWVHQQCAVWSPEVYFAGLGCLKNVRAALYRGRALKCSRCGRPGATIGCRVDRCPKTYHLPCARDSGCIFDHRKFLIACTDHRHIFQPHGSQYLHKLKKMKVKKLKMEIRKVSNDALRKDFEAEEKWMEHCGEDEEFLKRESKRLHRDLLRIAPTYIGASSCNTEMQFQGWESVAGLQDVIQCMKEVVILPLLYPEFFSSLGLTPPRGVLLHGYPGTGKTLVVRALIGSCARGDRRIAYFARKGADCLGKYVGDAERQLRLLFQVAEKSQPSIIFFDEIDGLAPSRTRQQDQTHSSVVSTLLALMDGLKSRGSVVVIGATNRPDAIDPALRRPGRFDREIYIPLPSVKDREAILSLHTQRWPKQISGSLLKWVSRRTVGFAGADLQALCTQAAIIALRRNFPLQELLAGTGENALLSKRPPLPSFTVEERDWLDALLLAPPPCSRREAGIAANDVISSPLTAHLVPCLLRPLSKLLVSLYLDERVWLPPPLHKAGTLIKNVIVSALVQKKALGDKWWSHLHDLLQEADILNEIEDKLSRVTILTDAFGSFDQLEDVADDRYLKFKPSRVQRVGAHPGLLHTISGESGFKSGFRILISGEARCGQRHLSSCLLHCFSGDIEIRKLDLATLSQEGHGDVVQGLTLILMRCASVGSCMLFLPRIDLWAVETCNQPCEGETTSPSSNSSVIEELAKNSESQNAVKNATYLWNSFIEQAESICARTPLTILATSEIPFADLPSRVKQFFRCDVVDCGLSTPSKDTVPRFVVEIDGNLNPDSVIGTTAAKLSVDLVQYFIYLVHHSIHSKSSSEKESRNIAELSADAINSSSDPGSITEGESKHLIAPGTTVAVHNSVKGKSSLLAAISTFGYQILRYPHFAELCWVTSKLKQGPCTPINGPWKGWPFNSCIVRPLNSMEGVTVPSNSSTTKNKDKSCVVRGLIAVGLSAYRGEYASLRAFSCEIRKVLELLVGRVDTKIQAGKDRYKFFRLLSQVAYFDDMVMSWAYTLRSLEVDAHISEGCPRLISAGSLTNHNTSKDCLPERGGYKETISSETLHESEVLEQTPQEVNAKHVGHHPVADDGLKFQNSGDEVGAAHEEASVPSVLDHYASRVQIQSPLPNGISSEGCIPMDVEDHTEVDGDLEGSKCCNGFVMRDSVVLEDGPHVFGDKCGMELSDSQKICNSDSAVPSAVNGIPLDNGVENSSVCSLRIPADSNVSGLVCMYHCCSHCLVNLYQLLLKLLNYEQKLKGSSVTVEDFHDFVVSLSISLQSAVRNLFSKNSSSYGFDEKLMERKCQKYTQCTQRCVLQPKNSGKPLVVPMECSCHSAGDSITTEGKFLQNTRQGFDTKFFFRDDVLVATLDNDSNDSFHCKFEKLCLCSLVECIVTSKDPLD